MDDKSNYKRIGNFNKWISDNYLTPWEKMTELEKCFARSNYTITKLDAEICELKERISELESKK